MARVRCKPALITMKFHIAACEGTAVSSHVLNATAAQFPYAFQPARSDAEKAPLREEPRQVMRIKLYVFTE